MQNSHKARESRVLSERHFGGRVLSERHFACSLEANGLAEDIPEYISHHVLFLFFLFR